MCELKITVIIDGKECEMSEVTFKLSATIGQAVQPLTVTPSTDVFTANVGDQVNQVVAVVTGGKEPYQYAADPNSDPQIPGLDFSEDGSGNVSLVGSPTTAGDFGQTNGILLDITDSAGATAKLASRFSVKKN